jgi:hypothetical protein
MSCTRGSSCRRGNELGGRSKKIHQKAIWRAFGNPIDSMNYMNLSFATINTSSVSASSLDDSRYKNVFGALRSLAFV